MHTLKIATISILSLFVGLFAFIGGIYLTSAAFVGPSIDPPGADGTIRADGAGNLGVGINPSGSFRLYIDGDVGLASGDQIDFHDEEGDKVYWWGTNYGTGIENGTLTHWASGRHRWRIGGTSVSSGLAEMNLTAVGLSVNTTADPIYPLDVSGDINFTGQLRQNGTPVSFGGGLWQESGSDIYFNTGDVGIGVTSPSYDLDIAGTNAAMLIRPNNNAPRGTEGADEAIRLTGTTSDYIISIQDGTGRVQHYWNASVNPSTYLVSGEVATKMLFSSGGGNPIFSISHAPAGTAGNTITWNEDFRIYDNGTGGAMRIPSGTSDPSGVANGTMYYNTSSGKFRCYQASAWTDCIGSATYQ